MLKEQKVNYTDIKSLGSKLRRDLESLCLAKTSISSQIADLKKDEDVLSSKIREIVIVNKLGNIKADNWRINHGFHATIDRTKLLENGVTLDVIERCTNKTPTIVINRRKQTEDKL